MNIFVWKWSKIAAQKEVFFFADFALVHPPIALVLLSASVERCFVSRMRDFFSHANKIIFFSFKDFLTFTKTENKGRRPKLFQLFTYAGPMLTLVEPNQMNQAILIDQLQ